jgi:putative glutamine amidotransferase
VVTRPRIVIAPHARELDTPLGRLRASIVYDEYFTKLVAAGAQPLVAWAGSPDVDDLLAVADGALLMGGGDVAPERFGLAAEGSAVDEPRDAFELGFVLRAKAQGKPVLGVCRGAQVLNVALGGTLREVDGHQQPGDLAQPGHAIEVVEGTHVAHITGTAELEVNSFHRWAPDALGDGLVASAFGSGAVEALEFAGDWWALGLQWHPELLDDPSSQRVFDAFVAAVEASLA